MKEQIEKQAIEEIKDHIDNMFGCDCAYYGVDGLAIASHLYKEGYRKQSVGEWVETDYKTVEHGFVERRGKAWLCTNCRHASKEFNPNMNYCPNCGAKMKGGAE